MLTKDFMSCEDSATETLEDGSEHSVIYIPPLACRSMQVITGLHRLDDNVKGNTLPSKH